MDIKSAAKAAANAGMAALSGIREATYDSLVYAGALVLDHLGKAKSLGEMVEQVRAVLDTDKAADRVK